MYRQRIEEAWGHTAHRGWARLLLDRAQELIIHGQAQRTAAPTARRCRRTWTIRTATSSLTTPRGGATPLPTVSARNHCYCCLDLGNDWVEGRVVDREVLASGDHRWRVQLPAPRHEEVIWMDRAEFLKQLEMHKLKLRLNHPARKLPTVAPVRGLREPVGGRVVHLPSFGR